MLCKLPNLYCINECSALGGKLENSISSSIYALVCNEHVKMNVKIQEAIKLGIPQVSRNWIDRLIIHVD